MIDTDKYEGHTPNEWIVEEGANGDTLVSSLHPNEDGLQTDIALIYSNDIDAKLIADAPLLLEEVKKLREENHEMGIALYDLGYRWDEETGEMYHRDDTRRVIE